MSPEHYDDDETKELDAPGPLGPWAHKMATPMKRPIRWENVKTKMLYVEIKIELVALGSEKCR